MTISDIRAKVEAGKRLPFEDGLFLENEIDLFTLGELANTAMVNRVQLSSTGYYKTPKIPWDREKVSGRPFYYFAYGAACSEVTVDTMTGEMRVERVDIRHDVGKSLNPAIDIGQIEGGFVQGMGWLTSEELVWDSAGRLMTHAPSTYKIPTASDVPADFRMFLHRHAELLRALPEWTIRLLIPRRFRKAAALYRYAVRDEFATPLEPSTVEELEWFFRERQGKAQTAPPADLDLATAARKFSAARFRALNRAWQREGTPALWAAQSHTLRDALVRGTGRIEFVELPRQYLQLTSLVGVA